MKIDENFQKKLDAGEADAVVRHVQSDSVVSIHNGVDAAEVDASQRNASAENLGLTARYDVFAFVSGGKWTTL